VEYVCCELFEVVDVFGLVIFGLVSVSAVAVFVGDSLV